MIVYSLKVSAKEPGSRACTVTLLREGSISAQVETNFEGAVAAVKMLVAVLADRGDALFCPPEIVYLDPVDRATLIAALDDRVNYGTIVATR